MRYLPVCCTLLLLALPASPARAAEETIGLAATAPAAGPSVKIDKGFMVPYKMTIPGTDATFEMVPVPGGKFTMGSLASEPKRKKTEGPQFQVEMSPFWMGKYEVTWAEYKQYMRLYSLFKELQTRKQRLVTDANKADAITAPTELYDPSFTFENGEDPQLPAVTMTQYAARQFTKWVSGVTGHFYRLPSEAEWEYACRAGSKTAYCFGDDPAELDAYAWHYENADEKPHKVGQKKPNAWGLYDMHGNVAELVLDQLFPDGYARFAGKTVTAAEALMWPKKIVPRVVRGGSFEDDPDALRSAARLATQEREWKMEDPNLPLSPWWYTSDPTRGVGFRILRPLVEPATKAERLKAWEPDAEETIDAINNRMSEGRGVMGLVDQDLPAAIKKLESKR